MNLKEWRRSKGWNQGEIAAKLRIAQNTYSAWETGRSEIPADGERDLRKLGFAGLLPRQEAAPAGGPYVTEAQLAEWRGYWRAGMEGVLKRLDDLEDQVRKLRQRAESGS